MRRGLRGRSGAWEAKEPGVAPAGGLAGTWKSENGRTAARSPEREMRRVEAADGVYGTTAAAPVDAVRDDR